MSRQGWDRADYRCGRCGLAFTATTEHEYLTEYSRHQDAHTLLDAMTPESRARLVLLVTQLDGEEVVPAAR